MVASDRGDPAGRRIARRRSALLSEAARVGRVFEVLLKRAEYMPPSLADILKSIAEQERIELQRSYGRIEPRTRFKGQGTHPLLDGRLINNLFIDESGKSTPEPRLTGPQFFALGAVALSDEAVARYCQAADQIKMEFFGRNDFAFHDPFLRQHYQDPKSRVDYSFSRNEERQREFDNRIEELLKSSEFLVFGVAVRKHAFQKEFVETGLDPYLPSDVYALAISLLLERYIDALAHAPDKEMGRVTFESQGPLEDAYHQLEYARLLMDGTQWVPDSAFRNWLETGLRFVPKQGSSPLELADIFSRDLYEWVRADCQVPPRWWHVHNTKVYVRGDGSMGKFGIKIFPDSDIREATLAHRKECGADGIESAPTRGAGAPIA